MKIIDCFVCPDCKGNEINEIVENASVTTPIIEIDESGLGVYYEPTSVDGKHQCFQCSNCGWKLPAKNDDELYQFLLTPKAAAYSADAIHVVFYSLEDTVTLDEILTTINKAMEY